MFRILMDIITLLYSIIWKMYRFISHDLANEFFQVIQKLFVLSIINSEGDENQIHNDATSCCFGYY